MIFFNATVSQYSEWLDFFISPGPDAPQLAAIELGATF